MASSLELLGIYESDEEDESNIQDSKVEKKRSLDDDSAESAKKKCNFGEKSRLPAPNITLTNISKSTDEHVDNPDSHNGRVRSFAHERGNWVTFIYIEFEDDGLLDKLSSDVINLYPALQVVDDYHVSLTKTFILRYHWIESFISTLKQNVSQIERFHIEFDGLEIYCNEERTRTFIGIKVRNGLPNLKCLVNLLDKSLLDYKLPVFYKDPSFHMSILWCVGDHNEDLKKILCNFNETYYALVNRSTTDTCPLGAFIDKIVCKTGNKLYSIPLVI